jgi:hypothetical protein
MGFNAGKVCLPSSGDLVEALAGIWGQARDFAGHMSGAVLVCLDAPLGQDWKDLARLREGPGQARGGYGWKPALGLREEPVAWVGAGNALLAVSDGLAVLLLGRLSTSTWP